MKALTFFIWLTATTRLICSGSSGPRTISVTISPVVFGCDGNSAGFCRYCHSGTNSSTGSQSSRFFFRSSSDSGGVMASVIADERPSSETEARSMSFNPAIVRMASTCPANFFTVSMPSSSRSKSPRASAFSASVRGMTMIDCVEANHRLEAPIMIRAGWAPHSLSKAFRCGWRPRQF